MKLLGGLFTALSLYSILPVRKVDWDRENMRYAMCFFPVIGAVIGGLVWLWFVLCRRVELAPALFAAVATLIPLAVSGGIHMDGFIDTADALSSHAPMERKLEILKDPHVGALGVLYCAGYLLLVFGMWHQLYSAPGYLPIVLAGYILSRCASALTIAAYPTAKQSGLAYAFADSAHKRAVRWSCGIVAAALTLLLVLGFSYVGLLAGGAAVAYWLFHRRFCIKTFGGNTGDLAGFFLQNMECMFLAIAIIGAIIR